MTKKKKPETGMDRLKALPLWQWGVIVIFAAMLSNLVMGFMPAPSGRAAARGQALGRGLATGLFLLVGIGMILRDVLRTKPATTKKVKKRKIEHE